MAFFVLQNPEDVAGPAYLNSKKEAQCVEFVRKVTCAPATQFWREGMKVQGNESKIPRGTAIATFVDERYPSNKTGNHAAIFLRKTSDGIEVVDQYKSKPLHELLDLLRCCFAGFPAAPLTDSPARGHGWLIRR